MIVTENLKKLYFSDAGPVPALDGVSLQVDAGEFVAIMGPSGCGKSTLLNILAGLDIPTEGTLAVNGQNPARLGEQKLTAYRRSTVGVIFQFYNLLPTLTVLENVSLPGLLAGAVPWEAEKRAKELLERVELANRLGHKPHQLSGGEMQRAAIARALVNQPAVLLADEPTGNLDSHTAEHVLEILGGLARERGATILMVTHSPEAAGSADRLVHMVDGRVVSDTKHAASV